MDVISKIQQINIYAKLEQWRSTQSVTVEPDERALIAEVFRYLYPSIYQLNFNCIGCIVGYLEMLDAYYQREFKG